jgi:hypothetical protein
MLDMAIDGEGGVWEYAAMSGRVRTGGDAGVDYPAVSRAIIRMPAHLDEDRQRFPVVSRVEGVVDVQA